MNILDKIFEVCEIKIKETKYNLKFTLSAVLWLEQNGIKIETLSINLAKCPKTTIFMMAFAGLPAEEFRNKISFEDFIKYLSDDEQLDILKKMDLLLTAFYKDLALKLKKTQQQNTKNSMDNKDISDIKKKYMN